jgi:hypothetical protein
MRTGIRRCLVLLPFLPLLVLAIPHGFVLMPEPTDPWYTAYTTPIWVLAAMFTYPVTWLLGLVGVLPFSAPHVIGVVVYAIAISLVLHRVLPGGVAQPVVAATPKS